tara:strand:- start:135 stop:1019 length:885 start_codon:yes stop_codon:yes gene_type:complete
MSQKVNDDYPGKEKMSDKQLKDIATAQYVSKTNLTTDDAPSKFPTEIVDLPSRGLLYSDDNPLSSGKLEMKYMTAKEEDILTTQSYIKQGVVLDKLFRSLIVGNGEGKAVNYNDLLVGDKNAIMIAARVLGYGKDYKCKVMTPSGEQQEVTIDLTSFDDKPMDEALYTKGINNFEFQLPASKKIITFKILTHKDNSSVEAELKAVKKIKDGYGSKELTTRLIHAITSIDGDEDRGKIRSFVKNELLAIDSRALRDYMRKISPDVDLSVEIIDNETGEPFTVNLPITVNFFWPSV